MNGESDWVKVEKDESVWPTYVRHVPGGLVLKSIVSGFPDKTGGQSLSTSMVFVPCCYKDAARWIENNMVD